ncbi:hypothetical protein [Corynebacterium auriscanis]
MEFEALIPFFDPKIWGPIIIAITNVLGPIAQFFGPVVAGSMTATGSL